MLSRNEIIYAANSFAGANLYLAHIAGTYIPADIRYRLSRRFAWQTTQFVTGIDMHGRTAGRAKEALVENCDSDAQGFANILAKFSITPSRFIRTDAPQLVPLVKQVVKRLNNKGLIEKQNSVSYHCSTCKDLLSKGEIRAIDIDGTIVNLRFVAPGTIPGLRLGCLRCGGNVTSFNEYQYSLLLNRGNLLRAVHQQQPSPAVRQALAGIREGDFHRWEFTRTNYYGMPMPGDGNRFLYLWFDSLISKLLPLGTEYEEIKSNISRTKFVFFFAQNILPYYGLVLPALLCGGFDATSLDIVFSVRGFCDIARSGEIMDIAAALEAGTPDELRFFCAYSVRDSLSGFALTKSALDHSKRYILHNAFGKYLSLMTGWLVEHNIGLDVMWPSVRHPDEIRLQGLARANELRRLLLELEIIVRRRLATWKSSTFVANAQELHSEFRLVFDLLSCYTPTDINYYAIYPLDADGCLVKAHPQFPARSGKGWSLQ